MIYNSGDRVMWTDESVCDGIYKNRVYTVQSVKRSSGNDGDDLLVILDDKGTDRFFFARRFRLVKEDLLDEGLFKL